MQSRGKTPELEFIHSKNTQCDWFGFGPGKHCIISDAVSLLNHRKVEFDKRRPTQPVSKDKVSFRVKSSRTISISSPLRFPWQNCWASVKFSSLMKRLKTAKRSLVLATVVYGLDVAIIVVVVIIMSSSKKREFKEFSFKIFSNKLCLF
jgi:hypothetical protein